jgi:hypothetical protein
VRAGVNAFYVTYRGKVEEEGDVIWNMKPNTTSFSGLIDLYPGARGVFRFTAGAMTSPLKGSGIGEIQGAAYTLNQTPTGTYPRAEIGDLIATARYPDVLPYVGLGFGTPASPRRGLGFVMDLGVAIGKPTIGLTSTTAATTTSPTLRRDLAAKGAEWQTEIGDKIPVWPVLSLGFAYRF